MSSGFSIHNSSKHGKIVSSSINTLSLNADTISLPSVNIIPLGDNTIYTIGGTLYYKSAGGTITVLASN